MRTIQFIVLLLLLFLIQPLELQAKSYLGPPSIQLRANLANVTTATLIGINKEYVLRFKKVEDLHNSVSNVFSIKSTEYVADKLALNSNYIVAFNRYHVDRMNKGVSEIRGPVPMVYIPGASPAIFSENDSLKKLFNYTIDESMKTPKSMHALILKGIHHSDPQVQYFFIVELLTREVLMRKISDEDFLYLVGLLRNQDISPLVREYILTHTVFPKNVLNTQLRYKILHDILANTSVELPLTSQQPLLIHTTLKLIAPIAKKKDKEIISRWLKSTSIGIVQAAISVLQRVDSHYLKQKLKQLQTHTLLDKQTRKIINQLMRLP